ncbi:hypothetical protein ACTID9_00830 [Brevibacillus fluminis]|uniref:hypothetical protein n=1 Tax=Brevibacillus fluminis TaxID=511487 RepID=UPI003F88DD4D
MTSQLDTAFDVAGDHLDGLVAELAELAYERIADTYERSGDRFIDDSRIDLEEADVFEQAMDSVLEDYDVADADQIKELVWKKLDHGVFTDAAESIVERFTAG